MRDYLLDIVKNTKPFGENITFKVDATDSNTVKIKGLSECTTLILNAETHKPVDEFTGVFGIGRMNILSGLLNFFSGKDTQVEFITKTANKSEIPVEIKFKSGDKGSATYRLANEMTIPRQVTLAQDPGFTVEIKQLAKKKISELSQLAAIYSKVEQNFEVKTEDGKLYLLIGQETSSTDRAKFELCDTIDGEITPGYFWNLQMFLNILALSEGAKSIIKFADNCIQIDIDSGLCVYHFFMAGSS